MSRASENWPGTERFEIKRRLGSGAMGVVYEAYDRERHMRVALKTLRYVDARALARFKREFRALHDLEHRNLISLGELIVDNGEWFFTMELVDGPDVLAHIRPGAGNGAGPWNPTGAVERASRDTFLETEPTQADASTAIKGAACGSCGPSSAQIFDEPKLRSSLKQLAMGITALHRSDTLHRDIKPPNILVTPSGRVVLVDFGLVTSAAADRQSSTVSVVGTVEYMAPEQAMGRDVGPAADWYGMGVVLYEALTGELPYTGSSPLDVLMKKQQRAAPPPRLLVADLPEDLNTLCCELLQIEPHRRPLGHDILERLGGEDCTERSLRTSASASASVPTPSARALAQSTPFVGRKDELALLRRAYDDTRQGGAVTVFIHGESGLGKSELVAEFTRELACEDEPVLVLRGRCYERESVPYKAFDGIADALCRHLMKLPDAQVLQLLPLRAGLLPQLFPSLQQVNAISSANLQSQALLDPQERRTRMFHAFRELLARLVDQGPVVLVIDDFQWAGADSLTMLGEVMPDGGDAPGLLLLGTARPGVEDLLAKHSAGDVRNLHLEELPPETSRELVRLFAPRLALQQACAIAEDAAGHPLFILELVRHLSEGVTAGALRLDDAMWSRILGLDAHPQRLVEVLAVAGAPLAQETAAAAARLSYGDYEKAVRTLRIGSLARTGSRGADVVEAYHDRVREAVLARLDPEVRKNHHRELALALERSGAAAIDPQVLVRHFAAAGEAKRSAEHAEAAAVRASATAAFDQAAALFTTVLELGIQDSDKTRQLRLRLGDALIGAGRGPAAAAIFLEAAEGADAATRLDCRRRAAEQLLISGHLERGLDAMRDLLREVGVEMPPTQKRALFSLLWQRAKLRLRGLGWKEKDASQISVEALTRLDIYTSASHGLGVTDVVRGMDFQCRGLLLALRTGERSRVARAMFYESLLVSTSGPRGELRARALLAEAARIGAPLDDPYLHTWKTGGEGFIHYFNGRYRSAVSKLAVAEKEFREQGSAAWELSSVRMLWMWSLHRLGAFAEMQPLLQKHLRDADRRGDLYAKTSLIRSCHRGLLAAGSVELARSTLSETSWVSFEGHYHLQHWFEFYARAEIALYAGDSHLMGDELHNSARRIKRSMLLRIQTVRVDYCWLRARLLLAECERRGATRAELREIKRLTRKLERTGVDDAKIVSLFLRAAIATQTHEIDKACSILERTVVAAQNAEMTLHVALAERRLGELLGGDKGTALIELASARMAGQGVADPAPMSQMLAPGFTRGRPVQAKLAAASSMPAPSQGEDP